MSLKHAILALLDLNQSSGYDLAKSFDRSIGFFWPSSLQQVYSELQQLEHKGWVEGDIVSQTSRPDKKVFRLTAAGERELEQWLQKPAKSRKHKDPFLIKFFAGKRLNKDALLMELESQRLEHETTLTEYDEIAAGLKALTKNNLKNINFPTELYN